MTLSVSDPTVSVIIPVYKGGDNFFRCLSSIKDLRTFPAEVIVVADGESDRYWKLTEKFDFLLLSLPIQGGPARARNYGAHHAKGEILLFIDADVTLPNDTIEKVVDTFKNDTDLAALI